MSGAQYGPVVLLNCSQSRCDALLVTVDDVSNIRLEIKGKDVISKVRELGLWYLVRLVEMAMG
jgi:hypothetical protein